jgi:hypothetical protein
VRQQRRPQLGRSRPKWRAPYLCRSSAPIRYRAARCGHAGRSLQCRSIPADFRGPSGGRAATRTPAPPHCHSAWRLRQAQLLPSARLHEPDRARLPPSWAGWLQGRSGLVPGDSRSSRSPRRRPIAGPLAAAGGAPVSQPRVVNAASFPVGAGALAEAAAPASSPSPASTAIMSLTGTSEVPPAPGSWPRCPRRPPRPPWSPCRSRSRRSRHRTETLSPSFTSHWQGCPFPLSAKGQA